MSERKIRGPAGDDDAEAATKGPGSATGVAAGVGLGASLGPAGALVGGLAGAVGGWWAGREVVDAAGDFSDETDEHYRRLHEREKAYAGSYDEARGFYRFGHLARHNPAYRGRRFEEVEPELRRGWRRDEPLGRFRSWDEVRPYVRRGYEEQTA